MDTATAVYRPQTRVKWNSSDAFGQFKLWRKEIERIINGPLASLSDEVKINHVYIWAGAHAETLIEAKLGENPQIEIKTVRDLLNQLESCLKHETHFRESREEFYSAKIRPEENVTAYFARILQLFKQCEFPVNSNFLVTDRLIHGCTNIECKRKLMSKGKDVSTKECLEILRRYESLNTTMDRLMQDSAEKATLHDQPTDSINAAYSDPTRRSQRNANQSAHGKTRSHCRWCKGSVHRRLECPARDVDCRKCGKRGHFAKACLSRMQSTSNQNAVNVDSESEYPTEDYDVWNVNKQHHAREVLAVVEFHVKHPSRQQQIYTSEGKVDTGAMVSCMPVSMLPKLGISKKEICQGNATLRGATGADLKCLGTVQLNVSCNHQRGNAKLYVNTLGNELILGLGFCKKFNLVTVSNECIQRPISIGAVHIIDEADFNYKPLKEKWKEHLPLGKKTGDALEDLKLIFPSMFDGKVGRFEGEADLKLSKDAVPVQVPPWAVPQSLLPKLKQELDKMEKEGIIRACPETTDWVHNLVTVIKKDGSLRLCLDPRNLNKYLTRSVHYTASWEDVQHSFRHGKVFSTLDAKSGYWTQ